jgi:hypothetical protein
LRIAYEISQNFKQWYARKNCTKSTEKIRNNWYNLYKQALEIPEFTSIVKMIRKHETEIIPKCPLDKLADNEYLF